MLTQNIPLTLSAPTARISMLSKQWQVGQILSALVQRSDHSGVLEISIDDQKFSARGPKTLRTGQVIQVQLVENRRQPVFRHIELSAVKENSGKIENLLRRDLPRQEGLQTLSRKLNLAVKNAPITTIDLSTLPKPVARQLLNTSMVLPKLGNLSKPEALKNAIQESGLFLEARLAGKSADVDPGATRPAVPDLQLDLKAGLLRLAQAIQQSLKPHVDSNVPVTPEKPHTEVSVKYTLTKTDSRAKAEHAKIELLELRSVVENALSRIQINQSRTIISHEHATPQWIIDIPFTDDNYAGVLELDIQQDEKQHVENQPQANWKITLALVVQPLGKINVRLNLVGKDISSTIWAEQEFTNKLIEKHLPKLEQRLEDAGLRVISLEHHPFNTGRQENNRQSLSLIRTKI